MGRRAIYNTLAEKQASARVRRAKYNQSDQYVYFNKNARLADCYSSAKSRKKIYNQTYYKRRHGRKHAMSALPITPPCMHSVLPKHIFTLAQAYDDRPEQSDGSNHNVPSDYFTAVKAFFTFEEGMSMLSEADMVSAMETLKKLAKDVLDGYIEMERSLLGRQPCNQ
jgi:hypothetical protein